MLQRKKEAESLSLGRECTRKGVVAMESGEWTEAERLLALAVKESPNDPEARRHYAEALWKRGEKEAAIDQLDQAIQCGGNYEQHARLAQLYLETKQIELAAQHADKAIDQQPEYAVGWVVRARILDLQKKNHDALAAYQRARALMPNDRELLWDMARLYARLNRSRDSLAVLQDLSNTYTPGEEPQEVIYHLGLVCASLGRSDQAIDYYLDSLRRGPPTPDILYHLAGAQRSLGNLSESQKILQEALVLDPKHGPSRSLLMKLNTPQTAPSQIARQPGASPH